MFPDTLLSESLPLPLWMAKVSLCWGSVDIFWNGPYSGMAHILEWPIFWNGPYSGMAHILEWPICCWRYCSESFICMPNCCCVCCITCKISKVASLVLPYVLSSLSALPPFLLSRILSSLVTIPSSLLIFSSCVLFHHFHSYLPSFS